MSYLEGFAARREAVHFVLDDITSSIEEQHESGQSSPSIFATKFAQPVIETSSTSFVTPTLDLVPTVEPTSPADCAEEKSNVAEDLR